MASRRNLRLSCAAATVCLTTACSSDLVVSDGKNTLPGIPVASRQAWVETGTFKKATDGKACTPASFQRYITLPTGPLYYVTVRPGILAKTAFALELDSSGAVTKVSLNSESQVPDAINAVANLAKSLPLAAFAAAPQKGGSPPCDIGEEVNGIQSFSDWKLAH